MIRPLLYDFIKHKFDKTSNFWYNTQTLEKGGEVKWNINL